MTTEHNEIPDILITGSMSECLNILEKVVDVQLLDDWATQCTGDVRGVIRDRIAVLLRCGPETGRCLEEATADLPCALTDEEAVIVAAKAIAKGSTAEARMDSAKHQAKLEKEEAEKQGVIRDRAIVGHVEYRPVQVQWLLSGDTVRKIRMDTGELIATRPATESEMQEPLPWGRGGVQ